jgi:hypothetical protein
MSDSNPDRKPKPQAAAADGPPRPPKKTARGLADDSPGDPIKNLTPAEKAEITAWLVAELEKKQK